MPALVMNCLAPLTVHSPSSSLARGAHVAGVGAGLGLGQAEGGEALAAAQPRQPFVLLLVAAPEVDRHRAERGVGGHRDADRGVDPGQLFDRQHVGERVRAAAPVLLRKRNPHQPQPAKLLDDLVGEALGPVQLLRDRPHLLAGELPHRVAQQPLLVADSSKFMAGQPMPSLQLQALDLQQLLEAVAPVLAAVTGLLVAAERRQRVEGAAVDLDLAGADPLGDADRPLLVRRPDAAGEPVGACRWRSAPRRPRRRRAGSPAPARRSPPGRSSSPASRRRRRWGGRSSRGRAPPAPRRRR